MTSPHAPTDDQFAAFVVFLADETERCSTIRTTPLYALRSAFRIFLRDHAGISVSNATFDWLLDDANLPMERLPLRHGHMAPHVCGIRLRQERAAV